MESKHADLLNDLHDMSNLLPYMLRRATLREAEELIVHQEQTIKRLEKELAEIQPKTYIHITCGDKHRTVTDLRISKGTPQIGCSLVNKGHDDLYDQGFRHDELQTNDLIITAEPPT